MKVILIFYRPSIRINAWRAIINGINCDTCDCCNFDFPFCVVKLYLQLCLFRIYYLILICNYFTRIIETHIRTKYNPRTHISVVTWIFWELGVFQGRTSSSFANWNINYFQIQKIHKFENESCCCWQCL